MSRQPPSSRDLLTAAHRLIQANNRDQARRVLSDLLAANPDNLEAWGLLLRLTDNYREEMVYLRQILSRAPDLTWAQERLDQLAAFDLGPETRPTWEEDGHTWESSEGKWPEAEAAGSVPSSWRFPLWNAAALLVGFCLIAAAAGIFWMRSRDIPQQSSVNCEELINTALELSDASCNQIGGNQVCYGNIYLDAELYPGAPSSFNMVGDVIDVQNLRSLSASPMNLESREWGIALFKLEANIAYTSPGQLATFIVFGNTNLTNDSGDMQAFYFSSGFGQIVCEAVPFDGIYVSMPDGSGISFTANGTDITLFGEGLLEARHGQNLRLSVVKGSGEVEAGGRSQPVGEGWSVDVPLDDLNPGGPPSAPEWIVKDVLAQSCTMTSIGCDPDDLDPVYPGGAQETVVAGSTEAARLADMTPIPTVRPGDPTYTPTSTPVPTVRPGDPTYTPTPTAIPTVRPGDPTYTPTPTPVPTVRPGDPTYTPTSALDAGPFIREVTAIALPTNILPPLPTATPALPTATSPPVVITAPPTPVPEISTDKEAPAGTCDWSVAGKGSFTITNNTGKSVFMKGVTLNEWPANNGGLSKVKFGSTIWNDYAEKPPLSFAASGNPELAAGQSKTLELTFDKAPEGNGYSIQADFDGCSVQIKW